MENVLFNWFSGCLSVNSSLDHSLETKPAPGRRLNSKRCQGRLLPLSHLNSSPRYLNPAAGWWSGAWWMGGGHWCKNETLAPQAGWWSSRGGLAWGSVYPCGADLSDLIKWGEHHNMVLISRGLILGDHRPLGRATSKSDRSGNWQSDANLFLKPRFILGQESGRMQRCHLGHFIKLQIDIACSCMDFFGSIFVQFLSRPNFDHTLCYWWW